MKSLPLELLSFAEGHSLFGEHLCDLPKTAVQQLRSFLSATMDEVRLLNAAKFTRAELDFTDIGDADHFRQGLLRREITGEMAYPKQRDHHAHTLHNYLLGWYFYCNVDKLREEMTRQFLARQSDAPVTDFRDAWPIVSILHDVGYLFEGSVLPLATSSKSRHVTIGAEVAQDYFDHRFWVDCGFDSVHDRQQLRRIADVQQPDFSSVSLSGVADSLRLLGDLSKVQQNILVELGAAGHQLAASRLSAIALPADSFDVWESHYNFYGFDSMAARIAAARVTFEELMTDGFDMNGTRILDHGVCGGLLLLLYATFYFRLYFGLGSKQPINLPDANLWRRFKGIDSVEQVRYQAVWWWYGVVWATGAVAIHNLQQQDTSSGPLSIEEDALAYLGVLVDCVQEWDRYTVSRESVIGGMLPLQGTDVMLGTGEGKAKLIIGDRLRVDKVRGALNRCLKEWEAFLDLS